MSYIRRAPAAVRKLQPSAYTLARDVSDARWRRVYVARGTATALVMASIALFAAWEGSGALGLVAALMAAEYALSALEATQRMGRWRP